MCDDLFFDFDKDNVAFKVSSTIISCKLNEIYLVRLFDSLDSNEYVYIKSLNIEHKIKVSLTIFKELYNQLSKFRNVEILNSFPFK